LDPYFKKLLENVEEFGWQCTSVAPRVDDDDDSPAFSYSIGFWECLDSPEVIVFGLPSKLMHSMLSEVHRQIEAGRSLEDGARWSDLISGFDCISRPVHPTQIGNYLLSSIWYKKQKTGSGDVAAYQLFWPGKLDGLYPWEEGCDQIVRDAQPMLFLPAGDKSN